MLRDEIVEKAMADAEVVFFMTDLSSVSTYMCVAVYHLIEREDRVGLSASSCRHRVLQETATTVDGLLSQQAKLMQAIGYVDYQLARAAVAGQLPLASVPFALSSTSA